MVKTSSIWKKLRPIIKEGNELRNQKKYEEAIERYRRGIDFVKTNSKDPKQGEADIKTIVVKIDDTFSAQISDISEKTTILVQNKEFEDAITKLNEALILAEHIDDSNLKNSKIKNVNFLISQTKLNELIEQGDQLKQNRKFEEAINVYKEAMSVSNQIYGSKPDNKEITKIKNLINQTYSNKVKLVIEQGNKLKQEGKINEAINTYEDALSICKNMYDSDQKKTEITNVENHINQTCSEQIKPLVEKGKSLIEQSNIEEAITELKKALVITEKMHESDLRKEDLNKIGELINPIYADRIKPLKEKSMQLIQEENFEDSISKVNEAADNFKKALDIANEMAESEEKSEELSILSSFADQTYLAGIKSRENKSKQLVEQKEFEKAISELYSALSISKNMSSKELSDREVEKIKKSINQSYSAQIKDALKEGTILLTQKKYDKAREIFNDALSITNKMYLSEEMERQVGIIKNLIYQSEMKQVVADGYVSEEQKKYKENLEELKEKLNRATLIKNPEERAKKIDDIKHQIDNVYSDLIKLLLDQGNLLVDQNKYDGANEPIMNALNLALLIEYTVIRDSKLVDIINTILDYGHRLANEKNFENAFEYYEKGLSIAENINDKSIKSGQNTKVKQSYLKELNNKAKFDIERGDFDKASEICQKAIELDASFAESYYNLGNIYLNKEEGSYDSAIELYNKAVELDENYKEAWNNLGLVHEFKGSYDDALEYINKAIEVDPEYAMAWYRKGNVYKNKNELDNAIESYQKAIDLNPRYTKAWIFIGYSFHEKKDHNKAIECLKKASELDPSIAKEVNQFITKFENLVNLIQDKLSKMFENK